MGLVRKILVVLVATLLCIALVVAREALTSAQTDESSWLRGTIKVVGALNTRSPWYDSMPCSGAEQLISVRGVSDSLQGCVFEKPTALIAVARYITPQWQAAYAIKYLHETEYHEVRGLCTGMPLCAYDPSYDRLITQYSLPYYRYGAAVYENFSNFLEPQFDVAKFAGYYTFSPSEEPRLIELGLTKPTVGAVAFSDNGIWGVFELHEYGLARYNFDTKELLRISWPGYTYGHGYNPLFEVAITNDGRTVAAAGYRVGLNIYDVSACGIPPPQPDAYADIHLAPEQKCPVASIPSLESLFGDLVSTHMPRFSGNGLRLSLTTKMANNTAKRVIVSTSEASVQRIPYIALGDSFTSGEGETEDGHYKSSTNEPPHTCHTSNRSYPYLLGFIWGVASESVACSGATTHDIRTSGDYTGQAQRLGGLPTQERESLKLHALQSYTPGIIGQQDFISYYMPKLITIGIGGNDVGMMDALKACIGPSTCTWAREPLARRAMGQEIQRLFSPLRSVIASLKEQSPRSAQLVIGYPRVINEAQGAVCDILTGFMLDSAERVFMNEAIILLNAVIRRAALAEGVQYGSVEDSFLGNRLCEHTTKPAMNAVRLGDDSPLFPIVRNLKLIGAESFHPTPYGHELLAASLAHQFSWPLSTIECTYASTSDSSHFRTTGRQTRLNKRFHNTSHVHSLTCHFYSQE